MSYIVNGIRKPETVGLDFPSRSSVGLHGMANGLPSGPGLGLQLGLFIAFHSYNYGDNSTNWYIPYTVGPCWDS